MEVRSRGKEQQFDGPYTVADNLLILKKGETPVMIGQVSVAERSIQFQAARRQSERSGPDVRQVTVTSPLPPGEGEGEGDYRVPFSLWERVRVGRRLLASEVRSY